MGNARPRFRLGTTTAAAALAVGIAVAPEAARAQTASTLASAPGVGEAGPPAQAAIAADATGDIVVTAQRRAESAQRVPIAVTVISPTRVKELNLFDVSALQQVTPGLQFNTGINYAQVYIRGVGYPNTTPGVETSVATYIDGVYLERGFGSVFDVVDPGSLQVLKGPQGTLWGRNATGGAILINTADPTFKTQVSASGQYGSLGHRLADAMVNVPLSDTLSFRAAGRYRRDGGYVDNLADDSTFGWRRIWTARGKLLFQPVTEFKAVAEVQFDRARRSAGPNAEDLPSAFCAFCAASAFTFPVADPYTTVVNTLNGGVGGRDRSDFYNLHMSYAAGAISLENVTAYRKTNNFETGDFDFTEVPGFNIAQFSGSKTLTQDLTATATLSDRLSAVGGVSYLDDKSYIGLDVFSTPTLPAAPVLSNKVDTQAVSVFAEATAEILPRLRITAGGRYTHDARQSQGQKIRFHDFTPRAVLAYTTGQVNLYVSYNKGYKSGGFSTPAANPLNVYRPETIHSYEVGIKLQSADRRAHLNIAAFHYDHDNLQVLAVDQGNIGNISQTQNATSKGDGFEIEGDWRPVDAVRTFGGMSFLHGRYTDFRNAVVSVPVYNAAGQPTGLASGFEDLSGYRLPEAPKWTAFGGVTLTHEIAGWKAEVTGFLRYSSSFDFYSGAGGPLRADRQRGYVTARATGQVTTPDGHYYVGFYVENLTDKTYFDYRFTAAPFGGLQYVARPRTYGLSVGVNFGS